MHILYIMASFEDYVKCPACTLLNPSGLSNCQVCGSNLSTPGSGGGAGGGFGGAAQEASEVAPEVRTLNPDNAVVCGRCSAVVSADGMNTRAAIGGCDYQERCPYCQGSFCMHCNQGVDTRQGPRGKITSAHNDPNSQPTPGSAFAHFGFRDFPSSDPRLPLGGWCLNRPPKANGDPTVVGKRSEIGKAKGSGGVEKKTTSAAAARKPAAPWNCPICTLSNPGQSKSCAACGIPKQGGGEKRISKSRKRRRRKTRRRKRRRTRGGELVGDPIRGELRGSLRWQKASVLSCWPCIPEIVLCQFLQIKRGCIEQFRLGVVFINTINIYPVQFSDIPYILGSVVYLIMGE